MKTADVLGLEETGKATLHLILGEPNEHGIRLITAAWTGLSFAGIVLLGAEPSSVAMNQTELAAFVECFQDPALGSVPMKIHRVEETCVPPKDAE